MYCVTTRNCCHHVKYMLHLHQLHSYKVVILRRIRQHQETMVDDYHKLHAIADRRQDIMRKFSHHPQPTPALDHIHYKWELP